MNHFSKVIFLNHNKSRGNPELKVKIPFEEVILRNELELYKSIFYQQKIDLWYFCVKAIIDAECKGVHFLSSHKLPNIPDIISKHNTVL